MWNLLCLNQEGVLQRGNCCHVKQTNNVEVQCSSQDLHLWLLGYKEPDGTKY
jgi:hypothetical protein